MSRRKTLLASEMPAISDDGQDDEVDDGKEKRRRVSMGFPHNPVTAAKERKRQLLQAQMSDSNSNSGNSQSSSQETPSNTNGSGNGKASAQQQQSKPPQQQAAKPSNEQLSCLYNSCVKMLNENKINIKNAFQLKLIDYMGDIVLNKDIHGGGGDTNFQVVGCTIDVGTKIYAARVDALHQNTYKMLSGLGSNEDGGNDVENGNGMDDGGMDDFDNQQAGSKKKRTTKKRAAKSGSQLCENLDTITHEIRDEFKDVDLYFSRISTQIENEAIAGTLLNKLQFVDESYQVYINADDMVCASTSALTEANEAKEKERQEKQQEEQQVMKEEKLIVKFKHEIDSKEVDVHLRSVCEMVKERKASLANLKLCSELSSWKFIGWNEETNDDVSKMVDALEESTTMNAASQAEAEELEKHRFDAGTAAINMSQLNMSMAEKGVEMFGDDGDLINDIGMDAGNDDMNDDMLGNTNNTIDRNSIAGMPIDDIRSPMTSVADLTTMVAQKASEYSYFDRFKMHSLSANIRGMWSEKAAALKASQQNNAAELTNSSTAKSVKERNKRGEHVRLDNSLNIDVSKFFKITKKSIALCDRTIEKRSEKPVRMEVERQQEFSARDLIRPYFKSIDAKIFSELDANDCDNLLVEGTANGKRNNNGGENCDDDDDRETEMGFGDDGPMADDDDGFDIPCTAGTDGDQNQFFTEGGNQFDPMSQHQMSADPNSDMMAHSLNALQPRFDGENLIEAPMQVNAINIDYAKTSKNIDVRRLKNVIWSLLNPDSDKENVDSSMNTSNQGEKTLNATKGPLNIRASLKNVYKQLRPPLITPKVFDDLSVCICFQMLLFLANEHNLLLNNEHDGSDVIITSY